MSLDDARHMAHALALGRRGMGNAWPNPSVGAVLVREGRIVGRGWTQPGGRPHAERTALDQAGAAFGRVYRAVDRRAGPQDLLGARVSPSIDATRVCSRHTTEERLAVGADRGDL